jgi:hypothetical protein
VATIITRATVTPSQSLSINDAQLAGMRALAAWYAQEVFTGTTAGDLDSTWIDVRGSTLTTWQIVPAGTFSGSVQATLDGGKTFNDVLAEVGANPLTAVGFYRFRGEYQYMRFKATAQSAAVVVSVGVAGGA